MSLAFEKHLKNIKEKWLRPNTSCIRELDKNPFFVFGEPCAAKEATSFINSLCFMIISQEKANDYKSRKSGLTWNMQYILLAQLILS